MDAHDDAAEDADNGSLEDLVESIDDDEVDGDEVDNWVVCSSATSGALCRAASFSLSNSGT